MSQFGAILLIAVLHITVGGRFKRIIGGSTPYDHTSNAWMVSLQGKVVTKTFFGIPTSFRRVYCGGTLVSDRWLLTAAHCFTENKGSLNPKMWHARFASPNIEMTSHEILLHMFGKALDIPHWRQMEYHFEKIVLHPEYNSQDSWANDVALVRLKERVPVMSTKRVGLIQLATNNMTQSWMGRNCYAYGWGCTSLGADITARIQKVPLPIIQDETCKQIWGINMQQRLCAGGMKTGKTACHGDSGGPLICESLTGDSVQVGVISFIHAINPTDFPVVFSKVESYNTWIQNTVR